MSRHEAVVLTEYDVRRLKSSGSQFSDGLLFHAANSELCSTVSLAWCVDEHDPDLAADKKRFDAALARFRKSIGEIENADFRSSVDLPPEYLDSIDGNFFRKYVEPRPRGGHPGNWRQHEFHIRLFTLYQMFTGQRPAESKDGPTLRFMREIVDILRTQLQGAAPHSLREGFYKEELDGQRELARSGAINRDELDRVEQRLRGEAAAAKAAYDKVDRLWRLSSSDEHLKTWFKNKDEGERKYIQDTVERAVAANVAAFDRASVRRPTRDNVVHVAFGGEKAIT